MRGLIRKELYMFEKQYISWIVVTLIMCAYCIVMKTTSFLTMMVALIGITSVLTTFSFDQMSHWDTFAVSLPLTRRLIVRSKYLFLLSGDLLLSVCALVLTACLKQVTGGSSWAEIEGTVCGVLGVTVMLQAVLIPVIYKVGVEKARYVYMAICLIPVGIIFLVSRFAKPNIQISDQMIYIAIALLPFLAVALVIGSYRLSVRIFSKAEF